MGTIEGLEVGLGTWRVEVEVEVELGLEVPLVMVEGGLTSSVEEEWGSIVLRRLDAASPFVDEGGGG